MTSYTFTDDRCRKLFMAAYPVKHMVGFAWRESPKTLDNHWNRAVSGKTPEEKDEILKVCLLAGEAQSQYRMAQDKAGEKLYRPKGIAVWFNSGSQYDEISSFAALQERSAAKICIVEGCSEPVHAPKEARAYCLHHFCYDAENRLRGGLRLVPELRKYYADHPEIHNLKGLEAVKFIKCRLGELGK